MPDRRTSLDARAVTALVVCCFLWGLNQVAVKVALPQIPPLLQAGARSMIAAVLVCAWARWRGVALFDRDSSLGAGLLVGVLFAAEFGAIFLGLQYTTASRMVVFLYLSPFVVALGMPFVARSERLGPAQALGLLLAFAGVAWAFAESFSLPAAGPSRWWGDALGVAAALLWGVTTLVIRASRLSTASAEKTLLYQLGVAGVALLIAGTLAGEAWPASLSALAALSFGFQSVIVAFASYLVWFWLVRHYPATRLASFTLLTPVFGLLMGAWLLGEPITPRLWMALAAVASGIVLVNRRVADPRLSRAKPQA
ncbi:MAG: DMT family transporter [Burkholderiaceae bacterium]